MLCIWPLLLHSFGWLFRGVKKHSVERLLMNMMFALFLLGIGLAFTRAAYISLFCWPILYFVVKYKLTKYLIPLSLVIVCTASIYISQNNRYVSLAPDYSTTIYHGNFKDLLTATLKGKDISSMERVHRWVAGGHMIFENPIVGFGNNTFYHTYQPYTRAIFETYVSDNPEKIYSSQLFFIAFDRTRVSGSHFIYHSMQLNVYENRKTLSSQPK